MNVKNSIGLVVVIAAIGGFFLYRSAGSGAVIEVRMSDDGYFPKQLSIKRGDEVKFINTGENDHWPASNIHPSHKIYPEFDPQKPVPPGGSWSFRFDTVGIWRFHDHIYPDITGTITVEE